MCRTCGCGEQGAVTLTNLETGERFDVQPSDSLGHERRHHDHMPHDHPPYAHEHHDHGHHEHGPHDHEHPHHDRRHDQDHDHDEGGGSGPASHTVPLGVAVLAKNDQAAARNRAWLQGRQVLALNLVSSPGSGKTSLLERTIREWGSGRSLAVIEGDQQTTLDAERIRASGAPSVQVNTGTGCHLDADMVWAALRSLRPQAGSVVLIENVGNLVCPALFDLGEAAKVAVLSVTEGEDKPAKYPHMFQASRLVLLNKVDLLPHLDFDLERCLGLAHRVNPDLEVLPISVRTGEGLDAWYAWLERELATVGERAFD